ncbi:hypothetical protein [Dactylosporangium sp. NPDC048998]|uniref:hypothetical protein n=1 Tax=Dactylosporangium sp. NPDC048998 TaxID=3363976 RepID=UPI00371E0975
MNIEDWSLAVAGASLLASIGGTAVAIWQARIARHAAALSEKAADASAAQALAAVEQANLLRRQLAAEQSDRALRDAPEYTLEFADSGEWGAWRKVRDGGREFAEISQRNNPPVHEWVKRRVLVLGHRGGPAVRASVTLDGVSPAAVEILAAGPFELVAGASESIPVVTAHALEGAELTFVVTSQERHGEGRSWVFRRAVQL